MIRELIETLWNVNAKFVMIVGTYAIRINRNIVECKFNLIVNKIISTHELIETLWNVNVCKWFASTV